MNVIFILSITEAGGCACANFNVCLPLHGLRMRNITNIYLNQLVRKRTKTNGNACAVFLRDYFYTKDAKICYFGQKFARKKRPLKSQE